MSESEKNLERDNSSNAFKVKGLNYFILPESEISLKLVFDNLRNYLVCSALIISLLFLITTCEEITKSDPSSAIVTLGVMLITSLLTILNMMQTQELFNRGDTQIQAYIKTRLAKRNLIIKFIFVLGGKIFSYSLLISVALIFGAGVVLISQQSHTFLNMSKNQECLIERIDHESDQN